MSRPYTLKLLFSGIIVFVALTVYISCSSGDDGTDSVPPIPTEVVFNRSVPTGRGGDIVRDYVNGKVLGSGETDENTRIAKYTFTQDAYDKLRSLGSKSASSGKNVDSAVIIDSTVVTNDNNVVATIGSQTINNTSSTLDVANNRTLWSHVFLWYGNDSEATFKFYDNGELLGTEYARNNAPAPTSVEATIIDSSDISTWDSIVGTTTPLDGVTFKKIVVTDITIGEFLDYQGGTGPQGGYVFVPGGMGQGNTFAITPTINQVNSVGNTTITARNISSPGYEYTKNEPNDQAIFENVFVEGDSDNYEITINSNEADPIFFTTIDTVEVFQGTERNYIIDVDAVQNNQDITMFARDFDNISRFVGDYTIELRDASNDALIAQEVTDINGQVQFEDVPGDTDIYVVGSGSGRYTKTSGIHSIPTVDRVSESEITLNVLANQKITYRDDGTPVNAEQIMWYLPNEAKGDYTPFALDELIIYFPEAAQQATAIQHLSNAANLVGLNNFIALDDPSQFQGYPSGDMIGQYNPFPGGETFPGQITTNVTSYFGGATNTEGKNLSNGRRVNFYTLTFNLGGSEALDQHEFTNLNWSLITGNVTLSTGETYVTVRDPLASNIVRIQDSKWDMTLLPYTLQIQKNHYTQTDSEGRLIEYSMPVKFED